MNSPRVLHLVISLAPGGLERLVVDWTNARNARHPGSTRICCLDDTGELAGQVKGSSGFRVQGSVAQMPEVVVCVGAKRSRWPFDLAAVRRISALLPASSIIHAHNLAAWQYGVLVKLFVAAADKRWSGRKEPRLSRRGYKLIYTQHGANVHNFGLRDRLRARLLACFTDELVAVSDATAEVMADKLWISRKRIRVVVNGVAASGEREDDGRQRTEGSGQVAS